MDTTNTLEHFYRPVEDEVSRVRQAVGELWAEAITLVDGSADAVPRAGGKLLRPALCLLSAGAIGAEDVGAFVGLATAFELLHVAALTHDDVVDKANLRRGSASLNALWDDRTAVLSGDYLVARSIELLTQMGSCEVVASTFQAVRRMTEGELRSLHTPYDRFSQEDCLRLAEDKTASYFAITCAAPTYMTGETYRDALYEYGLALGIAFQLADDILDIAQPSDALGKPSCGDIVQGKRTVPLLFMREALDLTERKRLDALSGTPLDEADRAWVGQALAASGARERTESLARDYARAACDALAALPDSPHKDSMAGLTEFVLTRGS
ncbi:MAG: hypothetical protein GWP08_07025 [Nitrospiraceae bacterium]|nr:hypothetical protein [Nitrospiraceae bacterium]